MNVFSVRAREGRMKHVWILNHYAQEPGGPGGTRHYSLARHLPASGWRASIIAASTDHPSGRQRLAKGEAVKCQEFDSVRFLWLRAGTYSGNGADRIRNMIDYTRAVLKPDNLASLEAPDAIIGSSVHPLAAWAGRRLARRHRVPFIFEVRDLWPQTLIDLGRLKPSHPAAIALRRLEKSLYRDADKIITLLPGAGDYIEPLGISRSHIVWIPNGVDLDSFPEPPAKPAADGFTLMYFGAHGPANALDNVLRAMRIVADEGPARRIELRLIGAGPTKSGLKELADALALANVRFEDPVPKSAIPALAAQADAFVFNLVDAPVFRFGISSNKLFDFMAARRPVLFCCDASNNPVADAGCGVTIPPGNPRALADAILELTALPGSRLEEMGLAGRRHLEQHYSMEKLAGRLAAVLEETVQPG